jgi:hypothetical protein
MYLASGVTNTRTFLARNVTARWRQELKNRLSLQVELLTLGHLQERNENLKHVRWADCERYRNIHWKNKLSITEVWRLRELNLPAERFVTDLNNLLPATGTIVVKHAFRKLLRSCSTWRLVRSSHGHPCTWFPTGNDGRGRWCVDYYAHNGGERFVRLPPCQQSPIKLKKFH